MMQIKLLEMPLTELEESINTELYDNPALEKKTDALDEIEANNSTIDEDKNDLDLFSEKEERQDALDNALERMESDEELPVFNTKGNKNDADYEEIVYGDSVSFIDKLNEQIGERILTDKQVKLLKYLIGSLDNDGLLRKDLDVIVDELAIYENIDCDINELKDSLKILQEFDPAGIGAQDLKECLLIQIERKVKDGYWKKDDTIYILLHKIFTKYYEEFTKKHWDKIKVNLNLSNIQIEKLQKEIKRLNPKPGASLGETIGRNIQQITPDFIVDTDDDGNVSLSLNQGNIPELCVSESFNGMINAYKENKKSMSRKDKETLLYIKGKVERAKGYIEAIKQRQNTLLLTMKTIVDIQIKFFKDGDEAELKPMILKDITDKTNLDISTISRVSNIKYVQTRWGTFPLRFFFSDSYITNDGEELSTRKIKLSLKEIISKENKNKPFSDELLSKLMKEKGLPIARRTVAKYREQMNIPVARLRKE